jgi:hypothetical protein
MPQLQIPPEVDQVLGEVFTCEFTTINTKGQPMTWPSVPYYNRAEGRLVIAVSVAFPIKAYNARKHPQVSMLFSDPTGSGLADPPAVLVQGDAVVAEVLDYTPDIIGLFKTVGKRQPESSKFTSNKFVRNLFVAYLFQRISLTVTPKRILYWPHRDFSNEPQVIEIEKSEAAHVG